MNNKIKFFQFLGILFLLSNCKAVQNKPATASKNIDYLINEKWEWPFRYNIKGVIEGGQDGDTLFLKTRIGSKVLNQSIIKDSKFEFNGTANEFLVCRINYKESRDIFEGFHSGFVLEETPIFIYAQVDTLDADFAHGKIVKSGPQNNYQQQLIEIFEPLLKELNKSFFKAQESDRAKYQQGYQWHQFYWQIQRHFYIEMNKRSLQQMVQAKVNFVKEHPDALYPLYSIFIERDNEKLGHNKSIELLNMVDPIIRRTSLWEMLYGRVIIDSLTQIGGQFRPFEAKGLEGEEFNFEKYENQFVFLDFWASWCGPCRMAHPGFKKVYEQYKIRNFSIVSISLDTEKEAWQRAIIKDGLPWDQFSDLKFPSPIAEMYGISSIPMNFLFDPSGKIIAKNLTPFQLQEKLNEVLK